MPDESMARPLLVDGRNMLDPRAAATAGHEWVGIGRPEYAGHVTEIDFQMARAQ